jgi:transposase
MDVYEVLRLIQLHKSDRAIANALGVNRKTVGKYRAWAESQGLLAIQALPSRAELHQRLTETWPGRLPPQNISSVMPFRAVITALREQGVEVAAIFQRLQEEHHYVGSYSSVWRFINSLEPQRPDVVVRIEVRAGEEAQVDFGYAGLLLDAQTGKLRPAWAFVMTLSWSRHQYVEFVFDQKVATWLLCHQHAFAYFGGVPERVVIDNLKAAIVRAAWDNPEVQQGYRECAEHYGFVIAPCRPGAPQHKGKVEQGGVHYVKRNFLAGRKPTAITDANQAVLQWCEQVAGQRIHGTTKQRPLLRFRQIERAALHPLPDMPYEPSTWKQVKLHRDCYVVFEQAFYSAPYALVGQSLWLRAGARTVELYNAAYQRVAIHDRATAPGQRLTRIEHLPPEKVPGLLLSRPLCQAQAAAIGPVTAAVVEALLAHRPEDRLRTAGRLLRLADRFTPNRLEAACERAQAYGDGDYVTVKRILETGLDQQLLAVPWPTPSAPCTFARAAAEFAAVTAGGA